MESPNTHEKDLSAKRHQAQAHTWISRPDGHQGRAARAERAAGERQEAVNRLTVRDHSPTRTDFPRTARLRRSADYQAVLARPQVRLRSPPLRLAAKGNQFGAARLGLVVAKRALSRAVDRNRAKRVLRESFRLARAGLPPCDIIVRVDGAKGLDDAARQLWAGLNEHR